MFVLAIFFSAFGFLGLFGSTFGSALLALAANRFISPRKKNVVAESQRKISPLSLDILVPAHNEQGQIVPTLESLSSAAEKLKKFSSCVDIRILVGADHCTDRTVEAVQNAPVEAGIVYNPGPNGKWNMLLELVAVSRAEWIAFVDAGSIWDSALLLNAYSDFLNPEVIGVAPSYRAMGAGFLERLAWSLERSLKTIESRAGGPVSVHGATVFYRREPLLRAFRELAKISRRSDGRARAWLNDDVVLPTVMRMQSPGFRISYVGKCGGDAWVRDYGMRTEPNVEYGRRKRILLGNLEWMTALYGRAISTNFTVGILASRRVFRAFWSYWLLSLVLASATFFMAWVGVHPIALGGPVLGFAIFLKLPLRGALERLRAALRAGLELPLHWMNSGKFSEKVWN